MVSSFLKHRAPVALRNHYSEQIPRQRRPARINSTVDRYAFTDLESGIRPLRIYMVTIGFR